MDQVRNPFSPGAGAQPPELVGRSEVIDRARVLIERVRNGRPEKSILLTGLRGVGKTVLLNVMRRQAAEDGYRTILVEVPEDRSLVAMLSPHLRSLLLDLDRVAGAKERVRRALGVLAAFVSAFRVRYGGVELSLDFEPERGTADSGDLETDLSQLFMAIAEAAEERETAVALLVDEMQYLKEWELRALIMAMHRLQQERKRVILIGAGLPSLLGLAGRARSYAERLFDFPVIGALSEPEASRAIRDPVRAAQAEIEESALGEIYRLTEGYPYYLQEWGYHSWNQAAQSPVTLADVRDATTTVIQRLD